MSIKLEKSLFAERLILAVKNKGIKPSPTVLANLFNCYFEGKPITPHSARNWLLGNAIPQQDKLVCLGKILDTTASHLRYGRSIEKTMVFSNDKNETEISNADQEFLMRFLKLDDLKKRLVRDLVVELSKPSPIDQN